MEQFKSRSTIEKVFHYPIVTTLIAGGIYELLTEDDAALQLMGGLGFVIGIVLALGILIDYKDSKKNNNKK